MLGGWGRDNPIRSLHKPTMFITPWTHFPSFIPCLLCDDLLGFSSVKVPLMPTTKPGVLHTPFNPTFGRHTDGAVFQASMSSIKKPCLKQTKPKKQKPYHR